MEGPQTMEASALRWSCAIRKVLAHSAVFSDSRVHQSPRLPHLPKKALKVRLKFRMTTQPSELLCNSMQVRLQDCTNREILPRIKIAFKAKSRFGFPSQGHPLVKHRPGLRPHVTDRWCASQCLDAERIGAPEFGLADTCFPP